MNTKDESLTETHIAELVRSFYAKALADEILRPVFQASIKDWDTHHRIVGDFWSRTLLNTDRYQGSPYPAHARLPIGPEHFERWLALFRETAFEVLPLEAAKRAVDRTEHMAESFKAGMFSGIDSGEKPSLGYSVL